MFAAGGAVGAVGVNALGAWRRLSMVKRLGSSGCSSPPRRHHRLRNAAAVGAVLVAASLLPAGGPAGARPRTLPCTPAAPTPVGSFRNGIALTGSNCASAEG